MMEIRLHGRGGQGAVTCAKILASVYARLGKSVQTFGDYAGERSGAPVRAYTRISDEPITNRNKVYEPDQLLVLDATLLADQTVVGLVPGGTLLVNSPEAPAQLAERFPGWRIGAVDATAIARKHQIGTRSLVIVNTTMAGAYVLATGIDLGVLRETYQALGFMSNFEAAQEAYNAVRIHEPTAGATPAAAPPEQSAPPAKVVPLTSHNEGAPTEIRTGSWRSQTPEYISKLAPCSAWCPAGNDVIGFVQAAAGDGGAQDAGAILGATTPLAGVCGRVCPAPCMEGCNRREYDGAVDIRGLERWIADHAPVARKEATAAQQPHRIAIVGGGPAGLSAAYELASAGHRATIVEGEKTLGGVLRTGIPTYRLPRRVLDEEIAAILALGVEARCGTFLDQVALQSLQQDFDAVILATGLQQLRGLDAPNGDLTGIEQGIRFLHRVNLGADAALSGHVVVLGGGNTAMDCARSALRIGAERVTVAYRRTRQEMPAIAEEIDEAMHEGVQFLFQRQPTAFHGDGRVSAVTLAEVDMGAPDESGRRRPVVSDRVAEHPCDAVLLALGQSADLSLLPADWTVVDGRIQQGGEATRVFVAGDLATGDGTVTHAIGDGRRAAGRALRALGVEVEVFERPDRSLAVPMTDIRLDHFARVAPADQQAQAASQRVDNFDEVNLGLSSAREGERCFSCGHCTQCDTCLVFCPEGIIRRKADDGSDYEIDYTFCKGCGICVAECPRCAMEMVSTWQSS